MKYSVKTLREAGLEAKWTKTRNGAPIIVARDPQAKASHQRTTWWAVTAVVWSMMIRDGIKQGFDSCTLLGDLFSVRA
jgi:hypothetical protein